MRNLFVVASFSFDPFFFCFFVFLFCFLFILFLVCFALVARAKFQTRKTMKISLFERCFILNFFSLLPDFFFLCFFFVFFFFFFFADRKFFFVKLAAEIDFGENGHTLTVLPNNPLIVDAMKRYLASRTDIDVAARFLSAAITVSNQTEFASLILDHIIIQIQIQADTQNFYFSNPKFLAGILKTALETRATRILKKICSHLNVSQLFTQKFAFSDANGKEMFPLHYLVVVKGDNVAMGELIDSGVITLQVYDQVVRFLFFVFCFFLFFFLRVLGLFLPNFCSFFRSIFSFLFFQIICIEFFIFFCSSKTKKKKKTIKQSNKA